MQKGQQTEKCLQPFCWQIGQSLDHWPQHKPELWQQTHRPVQFVAIVVGMVRPFAMPKKQHTIKEIGQFEVK